jgi:hypothetical protein
MRGVYFIVEGQTEEEFINTTVRHYFYNLEIYDVRAFQLETSPGFKGGDLSFKRYQHNIELLLKRETDIIVTSLIDFFRLKSDFPKYEEAKGVVDKNAKVSFLEASIREVINNRFFIPYIQLHEFEGVLFSDKAGFDYITNIDPWNLTMLHQVVDTFDNPELINDGAATAPSKRLESLISGYRKTLHGPIMADEIGMNRILARCPRFCNWISTLVDACKTMP